MEMEFKQKQTEQLPLDNLRTEHHLKIGKLQNNWDGFW